MTAYKTGKENPNVTAKSGDYGKKQRFDHDGFWKELVDRFFYPLLKRALPELYEDADTSQCPTFLDKEFKDILNTANPKIRATPRFADFVIKVPLKDGSDKWVLLHCETQRGNTRRLAKRMNHYRCLIFGHYGLEPVALVIITKGLGKKERFYHHSHYGTKVMYEYNNLVLSELDDEELMSSDNPIDMILYAAKFAQRAREEFQKLNFIRKAVELLDERGWSMYDKRDLLLFTERVINMKDEELISQYKRNLEERNREGKAMYVPLMLRDSAEKIEQQGIENGKIEGKLEGKLEVARNLLANGVSPDIIAKSAKLPVQKIRELMN